MRFYPRAIAKKLVPFLLLLAVGHPAMAAPVELSLDESIALALKNNPDMKIALSSRDESFWAMKQAEGSKGFALSFTHTSERYNTVPSWYTSYKYVYSNKFDNQFTLSLPIYTGGKLEGLIDEAKLSLKVSDLNIDATRQQLKQSVTTNYFSVLQCRNNFQISQETVGNYGVHLKIVQAQFNAGTVAKSDVLSSEVSLANAQNGLIKSQNNYQLAMANLNNTIGLPLDSEINLKEDLKYEAYSLELEDCAKYALVHRPEMAQYQAKIDIAKANMKVARSGNLPTLGFTASEDWYDDEWPGDSENNNWLVALTASVNILDAGVTSSKVKQAKSGVNTAAEQARKARDLILLEVRQYFLSMHEAEKRIETSQVAVAQAEENLRIAELRYKAGVGTNLDVLDAVLALNQAKTNYVQALYDYNTSKAQLDKAMGVAVK